jgi:uridine phosphorylase
MAKQVANNEVLYHVNLSPAMIKGAQYVLLPGDPGRVESLAKAFDSKAKHLTSNREHTSYLADFHNQKVLVTSTGMGGPSTGIAVEELAMLGLKYFLRVGTCGGIQTYTNLGDIIINDAAVRLEGASSHYAPIEYPAVASIEFTSDLISAAKSLDVPYHIGITASSDTFWPGQERHDNYSGYLLRRFVGSMAEWQALNVLNFEMEAATLFVMCKVFGLHAGCICGVVAKRDQSEAVAAVAKDESKKNWEKLAVNSIYNSMQRRGLIKE